MTTTPDLTVLEAECDECGDVIGRMPGGAWQHSLGSPHWGNHPAVPVCGYFAFCTNVAEGTIPHPILGDVPTCQRCADRVGLALEVSDEA